MLTGEELFLAVAALGAAATALWALATALRRSPALGVWVAMIPILLGLLDGGLVNFDELALPLGPVSIYPGDIISLVFLGLAVEKLIATRWKLAPSSTAALLFLTLATISLTLGALEIGLLAAGNQYRRHLAYVSSLLFFASHGNRAEHYRRFRVYWIRAACLFTVIGVARWIFPLEQVFGPFTGTAPGGVDRPLGSPSVLVILVGALFAYQLYYNWLSVALLAGVAVFQERAVWIAALVSTPIVFFVRGFRKRVFVIALFLSTVILFTALASPTMWRDALSPLETAGANVDTFGWRVEGWRILLDTQLRGLNDWLIGRPFGTPWDRVLQGRLIQVTPHNNFLEILLRTGILGLGTFLAVYAALIVRALRCSNGELRAIAIAVCLAHLVYSVSWPLDMAQGAIVGSLAGALSLAGTRLPTADADQPAVGSVRIRAGSSRQKNA